MAFAHSPKIVTEGLVLALDAANPKSYPGSGDVWYDLSGYGNHVTWQQQPTGGTNGNSAIDWDGSNNLGGFTWTPTNNDHDYFFRADTTTGLPTGDPNYSIEMVLSLLNGNFQWHIFAYGQQDINKSNGIFYYSNIDTLRKYHYGNDYDLIANYSTVVGFGNTFHFTETYDPATSELKCYINGELHNTETVGTNPNITLYSTGRLAVGGGVITATRSAHAGDLYTCKVYNKTLTAAEIEQNYNALRGRFGL